MWLMKRVIVDKWDTDKAMEEATALGLANEPLHGLSEVADFFFLLLLALATRDLGAFAEQAAEGVCGFGQGGVVGAVHKIGRAHV